MRLRNIVKNTTFITIVLSVFLIPPPVLLSGDGTSLTVRDMLYNITDPEKASSYILAFLKNGKNLIIDYKS